MIQRVTYATVTVAGATTGRIGPGLVVLVGVAAVDGLSEAERLARKVGRMRLFESEARGFDLSVADIGGEVLVVSQFTLLADPGRQKGARPDFSDAAPADVAERIYEAFCDALRREGLRVQTGRFGASMEVLLLNDGPVTIIAEVAPPVA